MQKNEKIAIENINCTGQTANVDAKKYNAMKKVLLMVIPKKAPGITQKDMLQAILPHLPQELRPGGDKSGWWAKTVQLDLEAKQWIVRTDSKPLTWYPNGRNGTLLRTKKRLAFFRKQAARSNGRSSVGTLKD